MSRADDVRWCLGEHTSNVLHSGASAGDQESQAPAVANVVRLSPKEGAVVQYRPRNKHKQYPSPGRRGSICPKDVDAPQLLRDSVPDGNQRYATDGERAYCAQCDDPEQDIWHGYPVSWNDVPQKIVNGWINERLVRRSTVRRGEKRWR